MTRTSIEGREDLVNHFFSGQNYGGYKGLLLCKSPLIRPTTTPMVLWKYWHSSRIAPVFLSVDGMMNIADDFFAWLCLICVTFLRVVRTIGLLTQEQLRLFQS